MEDTGSTHSAPTPTGALLWPSIALLLSLLVLAGLSLLLLAQVKPTLPSLPVVGTVVWTLADKARLAEAALIWSALGVAVLTVLAGTVTVAGGIGWDASRLPEPYKRIGPPTYWTLVIFVLTCGMATFVWELCDKDGLGAALQALHDTSLVRWPLRRFTILANTLTAVAIATLFAAAALLMLRARADSAVSERLHRRLQWLLALGAVSTVLGVLEISSLGRLGSASVAGAGARGAIRTVVLDAVTRTLDHPSESSGPVVKSDSNQEPGNKPAAGEAVLRQSPPLVWAWAKAQLPPESTESLIDALAEAFSEAIRTDSDAAKALRREMTEWAVAAADDAARTSVSEPIAAVAAHAASYWGLVFTLALTLLYLPTAVVLNHQREVAHLVRAAEDQSSRERIVDPILRVLATIAPFVVGVLAELMKAGSAFVEGS